MTERKPPRLNTAANICKAVAKYGLDAHFVLKPDGDMEIDIRSKTVAAKPNGNGSDAADPIETADELRKLI